MIVVNIEIIFCNKNIGEIEDLYEQFFGDKNFFQINHWLLDLKPSKIPSYIVGSVPEQLLSDGLWLAD